MANGIAVVSLLLVTFWTVANTAPSVSNQKPKLRDYLAWIKNVRRTATEDVNYENGPAYGISGNPKAGTDDEQGFQSDRPAGDDRAPKSQKRLTACRNGNKFLKTKMKNQRQQFKLKLVAVRKIVSGLFDENFDDPAMPMKDFCTVGSEIVEPPTNEAVLNDYNTGSDGRAGSIQPCQLSPWTDWSVLGFGTLERRRSITRPGCGCPPQEELKETIDIIPYLGNNTTPSFDPKKVGDSFGIDFLNPSGNGNGNGNGTSVNSGTGYHNGGINNGDSNVVKGSTINGGTRRNGDGGTGSASSVRDILMILDSSGSIESDDFDLMKNGLVTMIDLFCGGFGNADTNNHLALVQFASNVTIIHRFSDSQRPEDLKSKVMGLRHYKGNTCTGNALKKSMQELFTKAGGMRDFTVKDTLIVTDGQSNCGVDIKQAATELQTSTNVFALGVGIAGKVKARDEVKSVVSRQDPHHIFSLAKFSDFKEMVDNLKRRQATNNPCTPIVDP